jgi:hypothetical protein
VFCRPFVLLLILSALVVPCLAAEGGNANQVFTITVNSPTLPKDVQVRYFLGDESGVIDSTSTAKGDAGKIVILAEHQNKTATSFKAIAFAPGCQFVTFTVDDLATSNREGEFQCQKLPATLLKGRVSLAGVEGKDLQVQVLYVCNWAAQFFNIGPGAVSPFFVAKAPVATDGTFSVELPDFSSDPLWSTFSEDAFLSFHLVDATTGHPLNALVPPANLSHGSLLKVEAGYPDELDLTVQPTVATQ